MTKRKDPKDLVGAGRPSSYKPEYCNRVIALGSRGKSKAQIAAALGVVRVTLDNWANSNPEFLNALNIARELALAWWEDQGQSGLTADKFNATAFIFQMKNRFRADYNDRTEHTGPGGMPIWTVDQAALAKLSDDDIDRLLAIQSKLAAAGNASGGTGET